MKSSHQVEPLLNTPGYEDYQERGLRILGKMIARHLMKQQGYEAELSDQGVDDTPDGKNDVKNIP